MIVFAIKLILVHILGDFVLQPSTWVALKEKRHFKSSTLYYHIGVHTFLLLIFLGADKMYMAAYFLIPVSHFIIDIGKSIFRKKVNSAYLFTIDQLLHFMVIALVVWWYYPLDFNFPFLKTPQFLWLCTTLLFVTSVSSILLKILLSRWSKEISNGKKYQGMSEAGKYIGILERLFIFFFVVIGQWEGIGFLLTAKSIFRFGDLSSNKDHKLTEYILIGTLLSFGLAVLAGLVYNHVLGFLHKNS